MARKTDLGAYVRGVAEETQTYLTESKAENERLRAALASLTVEKLASDEQASQVQVLNGELAALRNQTSARARELDELKTRVQVLSTELESHRRQRELLANQLVEASKETQVFSKRYQHVQKQTSNLTNLYVASHRLHETLDRAELIGIIAEVMANIVGTEDFGIYELNPSESVLTLIGSMGTTAERLATLSLESEPIGRLVKAGETFVARDEAEALARGARACIPLRVNGQATGAIAIFGLLSHKKEVEPIDHELFELLATQGAMSLYCARLHSKAGRG